MVRAAVLCAAVALIDEVAVFVVVGLADVAVFVVVNVVGEVGGRVAELVDVLLAKSSQFCNSRMSNLGLTHLDIHSSPRRSTYLVLAFVKSSFHHHRRLSCHLGARDRQHCIHEELESRLQTYVNC